MKNIITLLLLTVSISSMAQLKTDVQLKAQADTIKFEVNPKANSATRVGNMFNAIVTNKLNKTLLDTSKTLLANSDSTIASQKAVKTYVDGFAKGYKEYRVRLSQTSTSAPSVQNIFRDEITRGSSTADSLFRSVTFIRNGVGDFSVFVNYKVAFPITFDQVEVSFNDAKAKVISSFSGSNGTYNYQVFTFKSYTDVGVVSDGILLFTNIYIRLY